MQAKLGEGVIVTGRAVNDAEVKRVGDKDTPCGSFSLIVGRQGEQATYANCKAWGDMADYAGLIRKGDTVCVIGDVRTREYNGKTYKDLNVQWMNVMAMTSSVQQPAQSAQQESVFDQNLPF